MRTHHDVLRRVIGGRQQWPERRGQPELLQAKFLTLRPVYPLPRTRQTDGLQVKCKCQ